jgi:hypothetical protein
MCNFSNNLWQATRILQASHSKHTAGAAWRLPGMITQATADVALLFAKRGAAKPCAISGTAHGLAKAVLSTMWFSTLKTCCATFTALGHIVAGTALVAQQPAAARVQLEKLPTDADVENGVNTPELPQDAAPKPAQGQLKRQPQSEPATVDPDLVKLAPGPIVRAIPVSKDCMVLAYLPDWNFGNVDNIGIGNNDGGVQTLIDWPQPSNGQTVVRCFWF